MPSDRASSAAAQQAEPQKLRTVRQYISKILEGETARWEKDEVLNVVYWWRQLAGIFIGVLLGTFGITGLMGFVTFFTTAMLVTVSLVSNIMGVDVEKFGMFDLLTDGMMGSFAIFMISWVLSYTAVFAS